MTLVNELRSRWESQGLFAAGRWSSTFIEDVGSAAAENVRSAAVRRWLHRHPTEGLAWISDVVGNRVTSTRLIVEREFTFSRDSRIDLCLWDHDRHLAFVELKWGAAPDDEQIERYRDHVDARAPGAPLIFVSPVRHAAGQGRPIRPNTYLTDWSQLLQHMTGRPEGGSIEDDLRVTLTRWSHVEAVVRSAASDLQTTIGELRDLATWMSAEDAAIGAETSEYPRLSRRLIISCVADAFTERVQPERWRRCLANEGAHGDAQADVSPPGSGDLWFPSAECRGFGIAVVLRFHAYPDFRSIDVIVGSAVLPYLEGQAKRDWLLRNPNQERTLFQLAARTRTQLAQAITNAGFTTSGRSNTTEWWKRSHCTSFGEHRILRDVYSHADKLAEALLKLR